MKSPENAIRTFTHAALSKWERGAKEHGGEITDRKVGEEIDAEIIDLVFYRAAQRELILDSIKELEKITDVCKDPQCPTCMPVRVVVSKLERAL